MADANAPPTTSLKAAFPLLCGLTTSTPGGPSATGKATPCRSPYPAKPALVALERKSRLILGARQQGKAARPVAEQFCDWFEPLDRRLRRSITFDNGTEFAQHLILTDELAIRTFFCDPHSPKGSIENAIGCLRRALPRKTNLDTIDHELFEAWITAYNNTPRKCLQFRTPAEVFLAKLLHFERESTPSLRSG